MARDLHLLPRRQLGVALADEMPHLRFETADLLGDVEAAIGRQTPQLVDFSFQLRYRPLELEKMPHYPFRVGGRAGGRRAKGCAVSTRRRSRSPWTCV